MGAQSRRSPKDEGGSSPELLGQAGVRTAMLAAALWMRRPNPVTREARPRHARRMRSSIVRGDDLDVLPLPSAIRFLVLDADVGEMHLVVEVREVVFVGPFANLIGRPIGVAVVVVMVLVALVEPALVFALQLVVQDDAIDVGAAFEQPRLGLLVRAIDLEVVLQFTLARQARVKALLVLLIPVSMALEEAAAGLGQDSPRGRGTRARVQSRPVLVRAGAGGPRSVDRQGCHRGLGDHDWRPLETHRRSPAYASPSRARCTRRSRSRTSSRSSPRGK